MHSCNIILECYNMCSRVKLSIRSLCFIIALQDLHQVKLSDLGSPNVSCLLHVIGVLISSKVYFKTLVT